MADASRSDQHRSGVRHDRKISEVPPLPVTDNELSGLGVDRNTIVALDFDGTLAPIVDDPDAAALPHRTRAALAALAESHAVSVVSGRALDDVARRVDIDALWYAGSHGREIQTPDGHRITAPRTDTPDNDGERAGAALDAASKSLHDELGQIDGIGFESKPFSFAVHDRRVSPDQRTVVVETTAAIAEEYDLAVTSGRHVTEIAVAIDWDKGDAIDHLRNELGGSDRSVMYIGDDLTDEDAFRTLWPDDVAIIVANDEHGDRMTAADYRIDGPETVAEILEIVHGSPR